MSLHSDNCLVSRIEKDNVYSAVRPDSLNMFQVIFRPYRIKDKCYFFLSNHHTRRD